MRGVYVKTGFVWLMAIFFLSCGKNPVSSPPPPHLPPGPSAFAATDYGPAWSPDGQWIAYAHGDTSFAGGGIFLIDPSGGQKRQLVPGLAQSPAWSPDGQWIAFENRAQIYKIKTNGDSLTQLTFTGRNFFPAWSPDGKWIAYWKSIPVADNGIWVTSINGMEKQQYAPGTDANWSRNNKFMIFIGFHSEIYKIEVANTANIVQLTYLNEKNIYATDNRFPKYSPDGFQIAFTSQRLGNKYFSPQIWIMKADGSGLIQLTDTGGYTCDWSPDSRWIVYTDPRPDNGHLWLIRAVRVSFLRWKRQLTF